VVDVAGDIDNQDPELEALPPAGADAAEPRSAGPSEAELARAERDPASDRAGYVDRLIAHRCPEVEPGEAIHVSAFEAVLEALASLSDRIEELEAKGSHLPGSQPYRGDDDRLH
jgi:hypothetical protein